MRNGLQENRLSKIFLVGLFLLCLHWPLLSHSESNPDISHLSADPAVMRARGLIEAGSFDAALDILRPISDGPEFERRPDVTDIRFLIGLAALRAATRDDAGGDRDTLLQEAADAFSAILVRRPELVRVRLELARTHFEAGEDAAARHHFERVLAGEVHPNIRHNVGRFLATIRARRRFTPWFGGAIASDSNISSQSDDRTIIIRGLPFKLSDNRKTSGYGLSVWTGGEYRRQESGALRAGGGISRTEYKGRRFDQMAVPGYAGPRYLLAGGDELSVMLLARRGWIGDAPHYVDGGVRVEWLNRLDRRRWIRVRLDRYHRAHRDKSNWRNGPRFDASSELTWLLSPVSRLTASVESGIARPRVHRHRYRDHRLTIGLSRDLANGVTVGASVTVGRTRFRGIWWPPTRNGKPRLDRKSSLRLKLHKRDFAVMGFAPQIVVSHSRNRSNAQALDYKRTRGELILVRQY